MEFKTKYITPDDFTQYFGIDLGATLRGNANPSDKANAFLMRIEDRMESYLNATFFKKVVDEWPHFTDWQKDNYRKALLEQAIYIFKNGDISVDSGYNPDEGIKIDRKDIKELSVAPNAIHYLELIGLWSRHIKTPGFFGPNGYGGYFL
jgi:hypothetical protein